MNHIWQILELKRAEWMRRRDGRCCNLWMFLLAMYPFYEGSLTIYIKKSSLIFFAGPSAILRPRSQRTSRHIPPP